MTSDTSLPTPGPEDAGDNRSRPDHKPEIIPRPETVTTFVYDAGPPVPAFRFSHGTQKRLFVLTWPDGKTEHFRDNAARQLMVEPDPDSEAGAMRPVIKRGQPVYVYLCREERELL